MKKIVLLLAAALVLCPLAYSAQPKKEFKTVVYLTDIDCEHCVEKVNENMPFEKGVKGLKVDLVKKTVEVKYDVAKNDTLSLRKAINKLGFSAKVVDFK